MRPIFVMNDKRQKNPIEFESCLEPRLTGTARIHLLYKTEKLVERTTAKKLSSLKILENSRLFKKST